MLVEETVAEKPIMEERLVEWSEKGKMKVKGSVVKYTVNKSLEVVSLVVKWSRVEDLW